MNKKYNSKFGALRLALLGWMISFSLGVVAQVSDSVQSNKPTTSQFNGLDYILQKPAKNEKFASKRFGDHLFFSGEGGVTMLRSSDSWFRTPGLGVRAGVLVGDWFTPVHGMRLGINAGLHRGTKLNPYFVGLSGDYLMNLSALLHKDNPSRVFELIGVAGLEYQLLYRRNHWTSAGGARLGLQPRFNFSPLTFFYLEPRFGLYTDEIDEIKTWRHYDWEASLVAGLGYRLLSQPVRRDHTFIGKGRGFFISGGAGPSALWRSSTNLLSDVGATAMAAIGNQFTPVSSFRLAGLFHYFPKKIETNEFRKASFGLQLDYLCNMHSLFGGYDPNRIFEMSGVLGGGVHDVSLGKRQSVYWSVGAGVHGSFRLNDHLSLFVEPRLDFFKNNVWEDRLSKADPLPTLLGGLTYYPVARSLDHIVTGEEFDNHAPLGNLYLTLGGGFAGAMSSSFEHPLPGKGFRVAAGIGTQWNPISGARLMMTFSELNDLTEAGHRTLAVGTQLDYMLYFSNLFWGYKPSRLFEVNGLLGLNYDYISAEKYKHSIALGAGLQGAFRINDMFEIYLEPRLNAGLNNRWEKRYLTRIDVVPTFLAGVNYNLYGYSRKHNRARANEPFSKENFSDHLFYGVGIGATSVPHRRYSGNYLGVSGSIYMGKWFTPASGLRASLAGGTYGDNSPGTRKFVVAELDYLWNINSTLFGYRPSRIFETTLGVGAALAYGTSYHTGFYPGLGVSLQGLWRVNPNLGIFVEPQIRIFGKNFSNESFANLPFDMLNSINAGIQYQLDGYDAQASRLAYQGDNNYFLSVGYTARAFRRTSANFDTGHGANIAFGKWYTPLSAWRVGVDYGYYAKRPIYMSLALSADYLFNLSAYMWQYKSNRVFDLLAVAGISTGVANTKRTNEFIYGFKAGLQGKFNITPHLDLFVEPQVLVLNKSNGSGFTPDARLAAGLNYKMGRKEGNERNKKLDKKNFISVSGGASMFSETILLDKYRRVSGALDISYGRWFTPASGIQVGYGYDPIRLPFSQPRLDVNSVHADYLLNLTSLFDANPERRFHLIGAVGAGVGWVDDKTAWLGEGRLQFRWNVSRSISLYAEPSMTIWGDKLHKDNTHDFVGVGRLSVGAAVRF